MNVSETILTLKAGDTITVTAGNSQPVELRLNRGDALLRGDDCQVWLENDHTGRRLYLRRLPEKEMSVGPALFASLTDLAKTVETGDWYIG